MAASDFDHPTGWQPSQFRVDTRFAGLVIALVWGILFVTGCRSGSDQPTPSSSATSSVPGAQDPAQNVADTASDQCGPSKRDRLYADAHTRDPATAARWYADTVEQPWQSLAEEACYLALLHEAP